MSRIKPVTKEKASSELQELYSGIEKKIGRIPNIFLNMGNSSAVLKGYLALSDAADQTSLDPKVREQIALIVSQTNNCNYCLSAHTAIAEGVGISHEDIISSRKGEASDPKTQAILSFTKNVVSKKGQVTDQDVTSLKAAGVSDKELVEIILNIQLTMFTNYFNHIIDTKIDFPLAEDIN